MKYENLKTQKTQYPPGEAAYFPPASATNSVTTAKLPLMKGDTKVKNNRNDEHQRRNKTDRISNETLTIKTPRNSARPDNLTARKWCRSLWLMLLAATFFTNIAAQGTSYSNHTSDQTLRSNGRVNPSTLGLEMDVPLASYPGRGGSVPVSLSYSSQQWRMENVGLTERPGLHPTCYSVLRPKYSEDAASGWTSSLGTAYIEYTGETHLFNESGQPYDQGNAPCSEANSSNNNRGYVKRIQVHLPNGESHELRASDTPIIYDHDTGSAVMTGTYYAVDGSKLKFIDDGSSTYRLYLPNGAYYDFASSKVWRREDHIRKTVSFTDPSGNQMTFSEPNSTYPNGYWTDTLGRVIPVPVAPEAPTSAGTQDYYLPGITNPYKFVWKQLKGTTSGDSGLTNFSDALKYTGIRSTPPYTGGPNTTHAEGALFSDGTDAWVFTGSDPIFNPIVLSEIELPNGSKYKFSYNIYGEIDKIAYPTGGEEHFTLGTVGAVDQVSTETPYAQANRGVTERDVYENASATPMTSTYATGVDSSTLSFKVTATMPDGTRTERLLISGDRCTGCEDGDWGFGFVLSGMPSEERTFSASNQLLAKKLTTWTKTEFTQVGNKTPEWHPRATKEESIIYDPANSSSLLSTASTMEYDGTLTDIDNPLNVKKISQYGFSTTVGTLGSLEKSVETDFLSDSNYSAVNIKSLPTETRIKDAAGNVKAKTQMSYDESGYGSGYRGLPTTVKSWTDIAGNLFVQMHTKYDGYGNATESTDANGNVSIVEYSSTYSYAYPTKVTTAIPDSSGTNGSSTAFETTSTYDATTGLTLTTTDANGQTTTMEYADDLLRPTKVTPPTGAGITEMIYTDTSGAMSVKTKTQIDSTNYAESTVYADGLGRAIKSETKDNAGNVFVETQYDNMGRAFKTSNPYRMGDTVLWTQSTFDDLSRVTKVKTPDNAEVNMAFGLSTSSTIGMTKTVTDQAGKKRSGITDGLGRMIRVIEDPTGQNLSTDYVYDMVGNLRETVQGSQHRYFMYDSLGRLLRAKQPEQDANSSLNVTDPITSNSSWSVGYAYDNNGNITSTTDARGITIIGAYDRLNRLITRDYSDSTPDVSFYYDGKGLSSVPNYSKGKVTKVSSSVSESKYLTFDNLGRIKSSQQITSGQTYNFSDYSYDLGGNLYFKRS